MEGHEVEDVADGAFAAGLAVRVEGRQGFRFSDDGGSVSEFHLRGESRGIGGGGRRDDGHT